MSNGVQGGLSDRNPAVLVGESAVCHNIGILFIYLFGLPEFSEEILFESSVCNFSLLAGLKSFKPQAPAKCTDPTAACSNQGSCNLT